MKALLRRSPWRAPLAFLAAIVPAALVAAQEVPDPAQAEVDLAEARAELEAIVGRRLLQLDPPPLPKVPKVELEEAEASLVRRLADAPPETWESGDRERLADLLARELPALATAGSEGEAVAQEDLAPRAVPLLQASRLLALRDRLALLRGREAVFADGLEERADLALRLMHQPILVGPLFGHALYVRVLEDVRTATIREETSAETLGRMDALLHRWELEAPDPAAVLARESLFSLDRAQAAIEDREIAAYGSMAAVFSSPWIQAVATLARHCRREDCRRAAEAVESAGPRSQEDPYQVIADMMIPNILHALAKLTGGEELGRLARTAVALRLEALEQGGYPPTLERLAPELGISPDREEQLAYERSPEGGARLRLTTDQVVTDQIEENRDRYRRLLTWDLPPVRRPTPAAGAPSGARRR